MSRSLLRRAQYLACLLLLALCGNSVHAQRAPRYQEAYPESVSKKRLQVEIVDDALALGVKHAALNVDLCQLMAPGARPAAGGGAQVHKPSKSMLKYRCHI